MADPISILGLGGATTAFVTGAVIAAFRNP